MASLASRFCSTAWVYRSTLAKVLCPVIAAIWWVCTLLQPKAARLPSLIRGDCILLEVQPLCTSLQNYYKIHSPRTAGQRPLQEMFPHYLVSIHGYLFEELGEYRCRLCVSLILCDKIRNEDASGSRTMLRTAEEDYGRSWVEGG